MQKRKGVAFSVARTTREATAILEMDAELRSVIRKRAGPKPSKMQAEVLKQLPLIAKKEGRIIGHLFAPLPNAREGTSGHSKVFVHPDYRNQGIAKELFSLANAGARRFLKASGVRKAVLHERTDSEGGLKLAEGAGYRESWGSDSIDARDRHYYKEIELKPGKPAKTPAEKARARIERRINLALREKAKSSKKQKPRRR